MKTKAILLVVLSAILSGLLSNCTLQKRRYTRGFYIARNHKAIKSHVSGSKKGNTILNVPGLNQNADQRPPEGFVNAENIQPPVRSVLIQPLPPSFSSCGDRILFINGEETRARVIEVTDLYVRYKPCDNLEGPLFVNPRAKVFMITYSNGNKQIFKQETKTPAKPVKSDQKPAKAGSKKRTMNVAALTGFILSLFSWTVILVPFSLTLGIIGSVQINRNPDEYKGAGFARAAVAISLIVIFLVFLFIIM